MKNKQQQRSRQMVEINLYRQLCIELLKIITASGIKLPANVMAVVNTCFPIVSQEKPSAFVYEQRCKYCRLNKKCVTGQYRFQIGGCRDKFKKKWYIFKTVKNPNFISKGVNGREDIENKLYEAMEKPERDI